MPSAQQGHFRQALASNGESSSAQSRDPASSESADQSGALPSTGGHACVDHNTAPCTLPSQQGPSAAAGDEPDNSANSSKASPSQKHPQELAELGPAHAHESNAASAGCSRRAAASRMSPPHADTSEPQHAPPVSTALPCPATLPEASAQEPHTGVHSIHMPAPQDDHPHAGAEGLDTMCISQGPSPSEACVPDPANVPSSTAVPDGFPQPTGYTYMSCPHGISSSRGPLPSRGPPSQMHAMGPSSLPSAAAAALEALSQHPAMLEPSAHFQYSPALLHSTELRQVPDATPAHADTHVQWAPAPWAMLGQQLNNAEHAACHADMSMCEIMPPGLPTLCERAEPAHARAIPCATRSVDPYDVDALHHPLHHSAGFAQQIGRNLGDHHHHDGAFLAAKIPAHSHGSAGSHIATAAADGTCLGSMYPHADDNSQPHTAAGSSLHGMPWVAAWQEGFMRSQTTPGRAEISHSHMCPPGSALPMFSCVPCGSKPAADGHALPSERDGITTFDSVCVPTGCPAMTKLQTQAPPSWASTCTPSVHGNSAHIFDMHAAQQAYEVSQVRRDMAAGSAGIASAAALEGSHTEQLSIKPALLSSARPSASCADQSKVGPAWRNPATGHLCREGIPAQKCASWQGSLEYPHWLEHRADGPTVTSRPVCSGKPASISLRPRAPSRPAGMIDSVTQGMDSLPLARPSAAAALIDATIKALLTSADDLLL